MQEVCPACGNGNNKMLVKKPGYSLLQCMDCSLIWKNIPNAGEEFSKTVNNEMFSDAGKRAGVKANHAMAQDRIDILMEFTKQGDIMEIGCATGEFLEKARTQGFNTFGIDLSENYVEYAKKKGLNVFCGRIEDIEKDSKQYDIIAMFHLIEHIARPEEFLKSINRLLKKDGLIYIVTPNANSSTNKLFGYKHSVYEHPDHYIFYSDKTLGDILNRSGFKVLQKRSREYHHHLFSSLKGLLGSINKKENVISKNSSVRGSQRNIKKRLTFLPELLGYIFYPALKPYSWSVSKKLKGHELIAIAQKL